MNAANCLRLVALAAIWGGSFLFMRIGAPVLGPVLLISARVGLGTASRHAPCGSQNLRKAPADSWTSAPQKR